MNSFAVGIPKHFLRVAAWTVVCTWALGGAAKPAEKGVSPAELEFFEKRIRPVLVESCHSCHSETQAMGGLRLDHRGGWQEGGQSGPALIPGNPDQSPLIRAIRHDGSGTPMPLGGAQLAAETIDDFEQWILLGAPDPRDAPPAAKTAYVADDSWEEVFKERSQWWSLQPIVRPPLPQVENERWSDLPMDRFILAQLEKNGLEPAPRADRSTLVRRLSLVLTGLPPTAEQVEAFVRDSDEGAYARLVDSLLDTPHFGERWARHWMDVVRYSDTYGYEWDIPAKGAWRFRDYLIRAFNDDLPFDRLVREQIAGDLVETPRINNSQQINESLIGPMFYMMGEKRHGDSVIFNGIHQEMVDDKIDAFSKAFQAMTVACARCHDHKLDAVAQKDYYALAGVLMSSRWGTNTLDLPDRNKQVIQELSAVKQSMREPLADWWLEASHDIPAYILAAQARIDGDEAAGQLAQGLKPERLQAWEKALRFEPVEEPAESEEKAEEAEEREAAEKKSEEEEAEDKPALEDILYPWLQLHASAKQLGSVDSRWSELAQEYGTAQQERSQTNAQNFPLMADFREGVPEGWSVDGVGLRDGTVSNGDFTVALEGTDAVDMLLPAGLFTHAISPRLNGALRSPFLDPTSPRVVSLEMNGGDLSTRRLVVDNGFLTEREWGYMDDDELHWVCHTQNAADKSAWPKSAVEAAETRNYLEFTTKTSNPYFPPRYGLGGCKEEEIKKDDCGSHDPKSWFGITRAYLVNKGKVTNYGATFDCVESPADELSRFEPLFSGDPPSSRPEAAARYGRWLTASLEDWGNDRADEDDVLLINWMLNRKLLPNSLEDREPVRDLVASYRTVEKRLLEPQTINGMVELDRGQDYRVNIRGVYEDLGDLIPRGHVRVLRAGHDGRPEGSGRLELANLVTSPENPLTARVFVNRVWQWVFGSGIVSTPNDFGHLGDQPTHPQLLDYLADDFVRNGWSLKQLIRNLVLSETFRQSGQASARAMETDPFNRLWHHMSLRRLDAESIRDTLLAVSGRLDRSLFGEPLNPYRKMEDATKRLFSGPLDGDGRRSIYLKMTVMEPSKLLATFNQPKPKIPIGRRDVTNVPAQALALLNDPFVAGQAEFWARELVATPHESPRDRLAYMFKRAFNRNPEAEELTRWSEAVNDIAALHEREAPTEEGRVPMMQSAQVWKDAAHALFNAPEFIYVR